MPRVGVLLGHFLLDSYAGPSTLSSTGQEAAALMQAKWVEPGVIHELQSRSGAVALVPNPVKKPLNVVQQAIGLSTSPRAWAKRGESEVFKWYREKKAEQRYQAALTQWQDERYDRARQLSMAETSLGEQTTEIMLKPGELRLARVDGVGLVESRRGRGHWEGSSSGVSVPLGSIGGHSVRYHTGGSRGTYVPGEAVAATVDSGMVHVTTKRVIFQGSRQTRECLFDKLIGIRYDPEAGRVTISVTNRQKPTVLSAGPGRDDLAIWIDLALAHYHGEADRYVARLKEQLAELDARKPLPEGQD